jgi:hypothetical protein
MPKPLIVKDNSMVPTSKIQSAVRARLHRIAVKPVPFEHQGGFIATDLLRDIVIGMAGDGIGQGIRWALVAIAAIFFEVR